MVVVVTADNQDSGLEMAHALCEAMAIAYVFDLPASPREVFTTEFKYAKTSSYVPMDVTRREEC